MDLNPNENVFYPMPYIEGEPHLLVITNQRVVHFGDEGKKEMAAREIMFVGRNSGRPFVGRGIVIALLALVMLGTGIYFIATSGIFASKIAAIPMEDPAAAGADTPVTGDDASDEPPPPPESSVPKWLGFVIAPLGLILVVVGALLVRVNRFFVLLRGQQQVITIRAKDSMEQTQILATVGALQTSSKGAAVASAAAAAPKPVKVDDKGDPVKALQDLAAARAAGKVSEEEFEAKREVLVQRVRARK